MTLPRASPTILVVNAPAYDGARLDRVLAGLLADVSRSELARWIVSGNVCVDGEVQLRPSARVRIGAQLAVFSMPPQQSDALPDASVQFDVIYEDDAIIVVDKPPGLVVHPAKGHWSGTLVNGLLARGPLAPVDNWGGAVDSSVSTHSEIATASHARARPGIVHRIDKGTSGVLVVARTALARERLKAAFASHDIERVYDAVVVGTLLDCVTFDTGYSRHPTRRLAYTSRLANTAGKRAITHVRVVERYERGGAVRVECRLETGRTHQIRVHLADAGTPLLGDALYGGIPADGRNVVCANLAATLGRQALHARVLGFAHPLTGKWVRFEAPWPHDFQRVVNALRELRSEL